MTTLTHLKRPNLEITHSRKKTYLPYLPFVLVLLVLASFALIKKSDLSTAYFAAPLRQIIGKEAVAQLETWLFGAQDTVKQFSYEAGLAEPVAPWQSSTLPGMVVMTPTPLPSPTMSPTPTPTTAVVAVPDETTAVSPTMTPLPIPPTATPLPPTATPTPWQPVSIQPLGSLDGEGIWSPYITLPGREQVIAYRAFLQPDAARPFTVVAVVAFDMTAVQLNYVLGSEEPALPGGVHGNGRIPNYQQTPAKLLAAFNGGFMATHGEYGAMADGIMPLPAKDGLATVAIGNDGRVHIGKWGAGIDPAGDWQAWRQNAYLVVENGVMTPETEADSLYYWSGSIDNEVVTWRSGLGLSADGRTLYYFAGPSLNMPSLGRAMLAVGVEQGMLLDINPYWVHFSAMYALEEGTLASEPLLAKMEHHTDRFLKQYTRDFFYITVPDELVESTMSNIDDLK